MRAVREGVIALPASSDAIFQAALGVAQQTKGSQILAVHNEGRVVVFRWKNMMSNVKIVVARVGTSENGERAGMHVAVGADPRTPAALMDGWSNNRGLEKYVKAVQGALDGSAPVTTTPMSNHYMQKKTEVPWVDPNEEPDIQLGGNIRAMYGL